jgi:valyl-tRNA synthetase
MASPGTDIAFNVARTEGYRAFANKIWNAARFILMNVDRAAEIGIKVDPAVLGSMPVAAEDAPLETRWIIAELHATAAKVNQSLENYRFDEAANTIYQFFWGSFCDWYLEIVKLRLDFNATDAINATTGAVLEEYKETRDALTTLVSVFEAALRLLSPFMPFITEELWQAVYDGNPPAKSIALTTYPTGEFPSAESREWLSQVEMSALQRVIIAIRALRKDAGVPEKSLVPAWVFTDTGPAGQIGRHLSGNERIIQALARTTSVEVIGTPLSLPHVRNEPGFDVGIAYETTIDVAAERERLKKDLAKYEKGVAAAERQLGNEGFLAKAPANVVEGLKKQEAETRMLLEKARAALAALPPE